MNSKAKKIQNGLRHTLSIVALMLLVGIAAGIYKLTISSDQDIFFSESNSQRREYERFKALFGTDDTLTIIIGSRHNRSIWNAADLETIRWATEALQDLPFVTRAESVVNFQSSIAASDEIEVGDLIPASQTFASLERYDQIRKIAEHDPRIFGLLVARDNSAAGIFATLNTNAASDFEVAELENSAQEIAAQIEIRNPHLEAAVTGSLPISVAFKQATLHEGARQNGLMVFFITLASIALWRSYLLTSFFAGGILFLTLVTFGAAGWLGFPLTPVSAVTPLVVMSIYIANVVHIISSYTSFLSNGDRPPQAAQAAVNDTMKPIAFTALTTAIGFLSLNFADAPPFRHFGNLASIGTAAAFCLSIFIFPSLLRFCKPKSTAVVRCLSKSVLFVGKVTADTPRADVPIVILSIVAVGSLAYLGASHIVLDDRYVDFFSRDYKIRQDADFAAKRLVGAYYVDYIIESPNTDGALEPDFLAAADNFCEWLRARDNVSQARCFTDTIKRINSNLHGDDPKYLVIPDSKELAAQILLLADLSLPLGQDLGNQVSVDKSALRVTALTPNISSAALRRLKNDGELKSLEFPEGTKIVGTGLSVMFAYVSSNNITNMLYGTAVAISVICVLIAVLFKSFSTAMVSLAPNILPIIFAFGAWGIMIPTIGMAGSTAAAICIGIIVDDTIHFVVRYKSALALGESPSVAMLNAYRRAGPAIILTSVILTGAFLILSTSSFTVNRDMGAIISMAMIAALVFDLFILSRLLRIFYLSNENTRPDNVGKFHRNAN